MSSQSRENKLVETFVVLADTLVAGYDVVDMLNTLVENSSALLGASEAGILLVDAQGDLEVVASTDERSRLVELMQLRSSGGPCLECFTTGRPVSVPDIDGLGERWDRFRVEALGQGFKSLQAVPLRLRTDTIGSLNLFWNEFHVITQWDIDIAQALADVATISILQERAMRESDIVRGQLQHALDSRVLIEQAKGVIAHTHQISIDDAFDTIRSYARSNRIGLGEVASQIVNRTLSI